MSIKFWKFEIDIGCEPLALLCALAATIAATIGITYYNTEVDTAAIKAGLHQTRTDDRTLWAAKEVKP